jgi:hypothetical protein
MSRKTDLERHIRESYDLIREYEAILQTSSDPKEKARTRRDMKEQWALIEGYLADYRPLAGGALPEAIAQIAAHFSSRLGGPVSALDTPEAQAARARYLAALRKRYGVVIAHSLSLLAEDERVGSIPQLRLLGEDGVYIPLAFDPPAARREALEEEREASPGKSEARPRQMAEQDMSPLSLADVLALPGHLAIIGDAGSGKTTLLHVLVTALAAENPAILVSEDLAHALPDPRPLPVLLPLRLFEYACGRNRYIRAVADLLRFVDDWFAEWCPDTGLPGTCAPGGPGFCWTPWTRWPTPVTGRRCVTGSRIWLTVSRGHG